MPLLGDRVGQLVRAALEQQKASFHRSPAEHKVRPLVCPHVRCPCCPFWAPDDYDISLQTSSDARVTTVFRLTPYRCTLASPAAIRDFTDWLSLSLSTGVRLAFVGLSVLRDPRHRFLRVLFDQHSSSQLPEAASQRRDDAKSQDQVTRFSGVCVEAVIQSSR